MTTVLNKSQSVASRDGIKRLPTPAQIRSQIPVTAAAQKTITTTRNAVRAVLRRNDPRLIAVVGPCSIHDPVAALEFGEWLATQQSRFADQLILIMRAYVEKPRTRFGWGGLLNDPTLDDAGNISDGIVIARKLLVDLHDAGVPAATEFVDVITSHYLEDVVSWAAIGARTAESPTHRQLASGLCCPVGFKNGTDGNLSVAIDGIAVARTNHRIVCIDESGHAATRLTNGNDACHLILRGGNQPNHDSRSVAQAAKRLEEIGLPTRLLIDCSHGNANQAGGQSAAAQDVAHQIGSGMDGIMGIMLESNLVAGCQELDDAKNLVFGQSVTDPCLGLDDTDRLLHDLADQVKHSS